MPGQSRQLAARIKGWLRPRARKKPARQADSAGDSEAEQQSTRWTCRYQDDSGARASATFDSAQKALDFAEYHAMLIGAPHPEWSRIGDTWLLTTDRADYLVCRRCTPTEPTAATIAATHAK